jgi:hypothetical protein
MRLMPIAFVLAASCALAQDAPPARVTVTADNRSERRHDLVIPAGTKVPLVLKHGLSTKTARVGDNIYASTSFPVAVDGRMAIPAGTYVQGEVSEVRRGGHVKGRAEVLIHFRTMIFPSGYTVALPGGVEGPPQTESGSSGGKIKDKEGTIQAEGDTAKKVGTVAGTAVSGAMIGAVTGGGKGAAIGSAVGGVAGMAIAMLSRGSDVQLPPGTSLEMVFQRSLTLDDTKLASMRRE